MAWKKISAFRLLRDAEMHKEGRLAQGFNSDFRDCRIGDLVTLLIAGGKLITHNQHVGEYQNVVVYKNYKFRAITAFPIYEGILNRGYRGR